MLPIDINKTFERIKKPLGKPREEQKIDYRHSIQGTANQIVGESMQGMNANGNQMQQTGEVYAQ